MVRVFCFSDMDMVSYLVPRGTGASAHSVRRESVVTRGSGRPYRGAEFVLQKPVLPPCGR